MARKRLTNNSNKAQEPENKCDDCKFSSWVTHHHLDCHGKPIFLTCPNQKYYIFRGEKACKQFERRANNDR